MLFTERRHSIRNDPAFLLALLYTCGFFGFLFRILAVDIPPGSAKIVDQLVPILSGIQLGIVQYFYNRQVQTQRASSDETIKQLADATIANANTANTVADTTKKVVETLSPSATPNSNGNNTLSPEKK